MSCELVEVVPHLATLDKQGRDRFQRVLTALCDHYGVPDVHTERSSCPCFAAAFVWLARFLGEVMAHSIAAGRLMKDSRCVYKESTGLPHGCGKVGTSSEGSVIENIAK